MKLHIDTAPVWEVYRQDCECPLCVLRDRVEAASVEYFLGDSVMEPSQRIEVNEKGFCGRHFKLMFDAGNRLGLALMTHTYLKHTIQRLEAGETPVRGGLFKRAPKQEAPDPAPESSCVACSRIRENMERYVYTIIYMYKHEAEFPALLEQSKGMCLEHYRKTMAMASQHLLGDALRNLTKTLKEIELKNLRRVADEVEWFTRKFDYRNQDEPWGNSRDAVERALNKLRGHIVN